MYVTRAPLTSSSNENHGDGVPGSRAGVCELDTRVASQAPSASLTHCKAPKVPHLHVNLYRHVIRIHAPECIELGFG